LKEYPDILGMELDTALALLRAEGLDFLIVETKPIKKQNPSGTMRVIRVSTDCPEGLELTVCKI
jgi:hypothetical protein